MKLVFVGSNHNIAQLVDVALALNYQVLGILDHDYWGNTEHIDQVPIIGTEQDWDWTQNICYFVATNWIAGLGAVHDRNRHKRQQQITDLEQRGVKCVNLVHPQAVIAATCELAHGIFVGAGAVLANHCRIGSYCQIREQSYVAHGAVLGQNVVLQVQSYVGSQVVIGDHSYLGIKSSVIPKIWPSGVILPPRTFVKSHDIITQTPG